MRAPITQVHDPEDDQSGMSSGDLLLGYLLAFFISVLVASVVIRMAVTAALRDHDRWRVKEQKKAEQRGQHTTAH